MAKRILLAEEDDVLRRFLRSRLEGTQYRVMTATDGEEVLRAVAMEMPDAIILDLELRELDGASVLRRLREDPETARIPILVLSGEGEGIELVPGLELDGDDFITRPYNDRELLVRLGAILRRAAIAPPRRMIHAGAIEIDLDRYVVKVGGEEVRFTIKEFELLRALIEARGRALRREFLLERVWGYGHSSDIESRTVDVHIRRLREKLGTEGASIHTVRNVGYRFDLARNLVLKAHGRVERS